MDMLLVILTVKKSLEHFLRNNCKKNQKSLEFKKEAREKVINCMSNGNVMIIGLIAGQIKKTV